MFDLKRFRKDKKISQTTLADKLGVGQSFISQIESGKDPMPEALISKLADIFQTDNISDYFIEDEGFSDLKNEKGKNSHADLAPSTLEDSVTIKDLMKAFTDISESVKLNAIANERNSRNMEKMLEMISSKEKTNEKREEYVERKDNEDAAHSA